MVKDLQYFINAENEFCKEHPNYGELFFDTSIGEMSEQGIDDRLNYLSDRIISNCNKIIKEPSEKELEFSNIFRFDFFQKVIDIGLYHPVAIQNLQESPESGPVAGSGVL